MIEACNVLWRTTTATTKSHLLMVTEEVLRHLLLLSMERSIVIVIGSIYTGTLTDLVAMSTNVALHDPTTSGNTYRMKIAAALSIGVSKSIADPASMAMTEIDRRSVGTVMTRTVVMTDAMTDGLTSIVLAIAIVMIAGTIAVMTDETIVVMTDAMTDAMTVEMIVEMIAETTAETTAEMIAEMTVDMTDTAKIVIEIVIENVSANGPKTRTPRMSAEPRLFDGWMSFAELATTRINEHKTMML
jgi:hypothetical protein